MLRVLIIGDHPFRIKDQIRLCKELLIINSDYRFTFLIVNKNLIPFFINTSKRISYLIIGKEQVKKTNKNVTKIKSHLFQSIINIYKVLPYFLSELVSFFLIIFDFYKNYFRIKKIIDSLKPNLILSNKDSNIGIEPVVLKIAKEKNINVIIPYLVYSDNVGIAELYRRKHVSETKKYKSLLTKVTMKLFPNQVVLYKNNKFLFYPPSFTFAYKLFGVLSYNPWYIGNGLSTIVCVDTQNTYKRYLKNNVSKNKLIIIGGISFDTLFINYNNRQQIRKIIIDKYNLDKKKKIIIISLPQFAELGFVEPKKHIQEINFLLNVTQKKDCNILISLHPRMNRKDYQFLEKKYRCKILQERLFEVISIADLFISTYSSTVIWSVLSKVTCIIIDFHQLNYSMYNFLQSVTLIKKKNLLTQTIDKSLISQPNFNNDWKELSRNLVFDGKTIQRYNHTFITFSNIYKK